MTIDTQTLELKLVRVADQQEVDVTPLQGLWTVQQYLKLTDYTRHLIEFTDGVMEILSLPTSRHQLILLWLYRALFALLEPIGGVVLVSALPLQIRPGKYREPDVLLLLDRADPRYQESIWLGADLVVEVVSPDDPERDTVVKRIDYAEAGISEYWIVNPLDETISVLTLSDAAYVEHGVFCRGETADSVLLAGFAVNVAEVFDAG